jgi:hypothetical protein
MALIPIPMPTTPLDLKKAIALQTDDVVFIYFGEQVFYTYKEKPSSSSPVAFSPTLPHGTFFKGDYIGPLVVGDSTVVVTIKYKVAGSPSEHTVELDVN